MKRDRRPSERTCIATRATGAPAAMVRFVLSPEGEVVPDVKRQLPGRGAWVTAERSLVEAAARRGAFARAFRQGVRVPGDLPDRVEALLLQDALSRLAIANKAGLVVTGFEKVREALKGGPPAALLTASDAAADGRGKLERLATAVSRSHKEAVIVDAYSAVELSRTLGRERVVHGAVGPGRLAELFCLKTDRLQRYRGHERMRTGAEASGDASNQERQTGAFAGTRAI